MVNEQLREARIQALLTARDLGRMAGVHEHTVAAAERGEPVSDLTKERLARALGTTRQELFAEEVAS